MADLIGKFTNRLEEAGFEAGTGRSLRAISASQAPAVDERNDLQRRRDELDASLIPDARSASVEIGKLLASAESYGMDDGATRVTIKLYVEACKHLPTWAIRRARERFAAGEHQTPWDMARRPSSAQLVREAKLELVDVRAEIAKIDAILTAEVYEPPTEAERAKVAGLLASFVAEHSMDTKVSSPLSVSPASAARAQAQRDLNEHLAALKARREEREAEADRKSRIAAREAEQVEGRRA